MPIILNGTTGITTPGITNTGPFTFQGVVELPAGAVGAPSLTTTGDTNTGIYFPAANQVAIATDGAQRVFIGATGDVGIGTSSPTTAGAGYTAVGVNGSNGSNLALNGGGTNIGLIYAATGNSNLYVTNQTASGNLIFGAGSGNERARIDSSGNLGLGVTPVASFAGYKTFQIASQGYISSDSTSNGELEINNNAYRAPTTAALTYINSFAATKYAQYQGQHRWFTAPSGTAGNTITFTQTMTLDSNGNLGVGSTAPTNSGGYKTLSLSGSTGGQIAFQQSNADRAYIFHDATNFHIYNLVSGPLVFSTNATERARITSGGDFGIGTSSPSYKLHVNGPAAVIGMARTGVDGRYQHGVYNWYATGGSAYVHFKTNLKLQSPSANVGMWNIKIYGYSYGSAKTVETYYCLHGDGSGNIYSPAVQNVGQVAFGVAMYKSSDGYLVIPGLMDNVYFFGVMIDCLHLMDYTVFDFAITNVAQSASPTGAF